MRSPLPKTAMDTPEYLHGMGIPGEDGGGLGSCADMIKTHSVYENKDRRHLNIDCNTKISSYKEFYDATFGAKSQCDLLNASYYDPRYVSAHNKLVYTHSEGNLANALGVKLQEYCKLNCNNEPDKLKNSVYAKAFTAATTDLNITIPVTIDNRIIYRANLEHDAFGLTPHVVTAINMSWAAGDGAGVDIDHLKTIQSIKIDDAIIDFQAFQYIVKKYTETMWHEEIGLDASHKPVRDALIRLSKVDRDMDYARTFYEHTKKTEPGKLSDLADMIASTPDGDYFCLQTFNCNAAELKERALILVNSNPESQLKTTSEKYDITQKKLITLVNKLGSLDSQDKKLNATDKLFEFKDKLLALVNERKEVQEKISPSELVSDSQKIKKLLGDIKEGEPNDPEKKFTM